MRRQDQQAVDYYEKARNRDRHKQIIAVAEHSGASQEDVEKVFNYLFVDEHDLDYKRKHERFDEDYWIAHSWERLRTGDGIRDHDRLLIMHEIEEIKLVEQGVSMEEAHKRVCAMGYDYQEAVLELKRSGWREDADL